MRLPSSNRATWIFAAVAVVVALVVAGIAVKELSKPKSTYNAKVPFVLSTTTASTTTVPPKKAPVNTFSWPLYGYTLTRTRDFVSGGNLNPPFKTLWESGGNALLEFPPAIYGNNMYYIDDSARVKKMNTNNHKVIWTNHIGGLSASTPALDTKRQEMYVTVLSVSGTSKGSVDGEMAALSMKTGKVLWHVSVPSGTESSPIVVGNSVYFGDQGGTEYSLNVANGHENWAFDTGGPIKAGADYYDGDLFFGNYAGSFYAVNAKSGKQVWSESPGGEFYSTPAVDFGLVYTGNNDGTVYAYGVKDGTAAWTHPTGSYVYGGPAVANTTGLGPTVYIGSYDGYFYALNAQNGTTRWDFKIPSAGDNAVSGSATIIDNTVYFSTVYHKGTWGLNTRTGAQVFSSPDGGYTSAVADPKAVFLIGKYNFYKLVPRS
jgi:outer membrane protein assembly factor BamB